MMYRLIANIILISALSISFYGATYASPESDFAKESAVSRQLARTPLIKGELYDSYVKEDKALNSAYKALSKTLVASDRTNLQKAQRQWIKWRDEKCDAMQSNINCLSASCYGVEHDRCVVQMTSDRTIELRDFMKNKDEAVQTRFDFSRRNKYLDDDF